MKFSILQEKLLKSLQIISSVVPVRSVTPVAENILFSVEGNTLQITGTDIEVSLRTRIDLEGDVKPGSVALPGKVITEIIRSLPNIPIKFEKDENDRVEIRTDKGVYNISGKIVDDYPDLPDLSEEKEIVLSNKKLKRMLSKTIFAVSSEELRPALMGVFLQIRKDELRMVATDGHRLSKIEDKDFSYYDEPVEMIIPPKAVQIAIKNIEDEGTTVVRFNKEGLIFNFKETVLYTRLVEGEYPDYERVIPRDNDKKMIIEKDLLTSSTKRVSIFSSSFTHQIRFSIKKGNLVIYSEDIDIGGEAREEIPVEYDDDEMEIGYNAEYILDILKHIEEDKVMFHLSSSTRAALVTPIEQKMNESFIMLIMPIKLNS